MKKVRYIAGAAFFAPVALAVATPATAQATQTTQAAATTTSTATGKTVSVQRSTAQHTAVLSTGCVAGKEWTATGNGHEMRFWTTDNNPRICVGTVEDSTARYGSASNHQFRLRIYASTGIGWITELNKIYAAAKHPGFLQAIVGVHTSWPGNRIQVCGAWVTNNNPNEVTLGPDCRIVNLHSA
jgi:hypothetical protein